MSARRCAAPGCPTFPDASWSWCAEHLAEREALPEFSSQAGLAALRFRIGGPTDSTEQP